MLVKNHARVNQSLQVAHTQLLSLRCLTQKQ